MSLKTNSFVLQSASLTIAESAIRALVRSHAIYLCTEEYSHTNPKTLEATIDDHVASLFL